MNRVCIDGLSAKGCYVIYLMVIERRLNKLLKDNKRSLYWLAKETGISEQALSNLKKGKTKGIEFETLDRICEKLNCQPGDLLVRVEDDHKGDSGKK